MNIAPHLPPSLQAVADTVLREFSAGVDEPEGLSLIHEWLEVDGWDFLIADLGEQSALKLGYIAQLEFSDSETRYNLEIPKDVEVQDADRLDAIGAIGIARTFNYGGFKNRTLYNPEIAPNLSMSKEEYKNNEAPTINHFYEKLLLLKDKMNTLTGKQIAQERHRYMEGFLEQFYAEWEGRK